MAGCTNAVYQMMAACGALLGTLAAVNSPYVPALAKVIVQVCADCQKECEKFPDVAECKACGDSARPAPMNVARLGPRPPPIGAQPCAGWSLQLQQKLRVLERH